MRKFRHVLASVLCVVFVIPTVRAQQHIVEPATLEQALAVQTSQDRADREIVLRVLGRPEVREVAGRIGVPLDRAEAVVQTVEGIELRQLATQARQVENQLAGGATVTFTTTTIIIVLLLIILLIVAID